MKEGGRGTEVAMIWQPGWEHMCAVTSGFVLLSVSSFRFLFVIVIKMPTTIIDLISLRRASQMRGRACSNQN
jgi:hypothetical protein